MPLAYYASKIGPSQSEMPLEGYRLCRGVRICRTGVQQYTGDELMAHRDYDASWGLRADAMYDVLRPLSEVTSPETRSSFEGKTVTDGHPPTSGGLISCETEREYGRGHVQNVRVGDDLADGTTPLVADLVLKDDDLIDRVDAGVRDVSAGYTYRLRRLTDGRLVQRTIRGNHVAVVERGRAGSSIAIQDAAPRDPFGSIHSPMQYFAGVSVKEGQAAMQKAFAEARVGPELSPGHFFNGVSHEAGKRAYAEYRRQRGLSPIG